MTTTADAVEYVEDVLLDLLNRYPWLATTELIALTGFGPDQVRRALAWQVEHGEVMRRLVRVEPWPRCALYAPTLPDGRLAAPHRLVRLEHTRLAHTLLVWLTSAGQRPRLRVALSGEAGGPPVGPAGWRLAGLADAWLVKDEAGPGELPGLLLRWDAGERTERAERGWLERLASLRPYEPAVAIVCATPAALAAWGSRLQHLDWEPDIRLALVDDVIDRLNGGTGPVWRDSHGQPAGLGLAGWLPLRRLVTDRLAAGASGDSGALCPIVEAAMRPTPAQVAQRLGLCSAALTTLRTVATMPLLDHAQLAWFLGTDDRQARRHLAVLRRLGLVRVEANGLYAAQAGIALLARCAGLPTRDYRRLTPTGGGRLPRPGGRRGTRALGLLAHHRRHTQGVITLHQHVVAAVARWRGRPVVRLVRWEGPAGRPVYFETDDPRLVVRRRGWSAGERDGAAVWLGKVEPDAVAWLAIGDGQDEQVVRLLLELDYATEGPRRLARKLRHYAGWAQAKRPRQWLLFVVPTVAREEVVHRVMAQATAAIRGEPAPLLTTSFDRLARDSALGAIWWDGRTRRRRSLIDIADVVG